MYVKRDLWFMYQEIVEVCIESSGVCQKRNVFVCQKRPTVCEKRNVLCVKRDLQCA